VGKKQLGDKEWKKKLTPEQYKVLRQKGTEQAFSGEYWECDTEGTYTCAGCGEPLFSSETKFKSGTGWPSFTDPVDPKNITLKDDVGFFTKRTEVLCSHCEGHLGHLFHDGPNPARTRYCINSSALKLKKKN
jgi:peptide-methionine (R)-S-oxide reductase